MVVVWRIDVCDRGRRGVARGIDPDRFCHHGGCHRKVHVMADRACVRSIETLAMIVFLHVVPLVMILLILLGAALDDTEPPSGEIGLSGPQRLAAVGFVGLFVSIGVFIWLVDLGVNMNRLWLASLVLVFVAGTWESG